MGETMWRARLRWRLAGATQWPVFVVVMVLDALLLARLPIAGDRGLGLVPALLLAGALNLGLIAVAAPMAGLLLRRRDPALPRVVADDRAGTALLATGVLALACAGAAHHPAVRAAGGDLDAQAAAARAYAAVHAPPRFQAGIGRLDSWKQGEDLYRSCVGGPDPRRAYCMVVRTDVRPPSVVEDPDQRPNETVAGRDNPGRRRR